MKNQKIIASPATASMSALGTGLESPTSSTEAAVFSLENVPSGGLIYAAIEASAAATDVERIG